MPAATDQPRTESALELASMIAVGLGVVTFALFPFLIPGIALLALGVVPLVLLAVPGALLAAIAAAAYFVVRGVGRRISRREQSARISLADRGDWV